MTTPAAGAGAGFNIQGLLSNPLFNLGTGLLVSGLSGPSSIGQGVGQGLQFGLAQQGQVARNELMRERIQAAAASREANARRERALGLLQDRLDADDTEGPLTRNELVGLLSDIAPNAVAQGLLSRALPAPQQATSFQRDFLFLTQRGIQQGLTPEAAQERALNTLRRGTTVNVGQEKALSVSDAARMVLPDGSPPPPGITVREAIGMGARVRPRQPTSDEERRETQTVIGLDTLNRLDAVVQENKIKPGFISEGGIAQFLETPTGQVISEIGKTMFGRNIEVTPAQAEALSLQESLSNQLIAAMRGAAVGPAEQERFERQLPRLTQTPDVFRANIRNTRRNLRLLADRQEKARTGRASPSRSEGSGTGRPSRAPKTERRVDFNDLPG